MQVKFKMCKLTLLVLTFFAPYGSCHVKNNSMLASMFATETRNPSIFRPDLQMNFLANQPGGISQRQPVSVGMNLNSDRMLPPSRRQSNFLDAQNQKINTAVNNINNLGPSYNIPGINNQVQRQPAVAFVPQTFRDARRRRRPSTNIMKSGHRVSFQPTTDLTRNNPDTFLRESQQGTIQVLRRQSLPARRTSRSRNIRPVGSRVNQLDQVGSIRDIQPRISSFDLTNRFLDNNRVNLMRNRFSDSQFQSAPSRDSRVLDSRMSRRSNVQFNRLNVDGGADMPSMSSFGRPSVHLKEVLTPDVVRTPIVRPVSNERGSISYIPVPIAVDVFGNAISSRRALQRHTLVLKMERGGKDEVGIVIGDPRPAGDVALMETRGQLPHRSQSQYTLSIPNGPPNGHADMVGGHFHESGKYHPRPHGPQDAGPTGSSHTADHTHHVSQTSAQNGPSAKTVVPHQYRHSNAAVNSIPLQHRQRNRPLITKLPSAQSPPQNIPVINKVSSRRPHQTINSNALPRNNPVINKLIAFQARQNNHNVEHVATAASHDHHNTETHTHKHGQHKTESHTHKHGQHETESHTHKNGQHKTETHAHSIKPIVNEAQNGIPSLNSLLGMDASHKETADVQTPPFQVSAIVNSVTVHPTDGISDGFV